VSKLSLAAVEVIAGKYAGRVGHVVKRWTHARSGVPYLDLQIQGDPARDQMPRDFSSFIKTPPWSFVVTVRERRTREYAP